MPEDQIDHILIGARWTSSIQDFQVFKDSDTCSADG